MLQLSLSLAFPLSPKNVDERLGGCCSSSKRRDRSWDGDVNISSLLEYTDDDGDDDDDDDDDEIFIG